MSRKSLKYCRFFACLALGWAAGCGNRIERQLEGRWLGDSVENFRDGEVAAATGWVKGLSFDFSGSTVRVTVPAEEPRTARYEVASVRGSDVNLSIRRPNGEVDTARLKLDDGYSLRWMIGEGRAVVLSREP